MKRTLHEVDGGLVRSLLRQTRDLRAGPLLLAAREIYEDHQYARLDDVGVEFERVAEGVLCKLVVVRAAQTFQHAVGEASAEAAVRERERRVQAYRVLEVFDGVVAV